MHQVGMFTSDSSSTADLQERPEAILPTMGGQTALNLAKALAEVNQSICHRSLYPATMSFFIMAASAVWHANYLIFI